MSNIRSNYSYKRLRLAALAAMVSTLATSLAQAGIGSVLFLVRKWPDWLPYAFGISIIISIAAITQAFAFLRRWQIGAGVSLLGGLVFVVVQWLSNPDLGPRLVSGSVRYWILILSYGAIFGGFGWVMTTIGLRYKQCAKDEELQKVSQIPQDESAVQPKQFAEVESDAIDSNDKPIQFTSTLTERAGCFFIFARIDGITATPFGGTGAHAISGYKPHSSSEIFAAVSALQTAIKGPHPSYTSPYGAFIVVPPEPRPAVETAIRLLQSTANAGVRVAIGMTYGARYEKTKDLVGENITATALNQAARLAHLPGGSGKIAIHSTIHGWIAENSEFSLGKREERPVKKTQLQFHWLNVPIPPIQRLVPRVHKEATIATIVVYDVEDFSQQNSAGLGIIAYKLYQTATESLNQFHGQSEQLDEHKVPYAPAGDGGALVFRHSAQAFTFAECLISAAEAADLPIRVGITTGLIITFDHGYPVGRGIYEADDLSAFGKPDTGCICVSEDYWSHTLEGKIEHPRPKHVYETKSHRANHWRATHDPKHKYVKLVSTAVQAAGNPNVGRFSGLIKWVIAILSVTSITAIVIFAPLLVRHQQDMQHVDSYTRNTTYIIHLYGYSLGVIPLGNEQLANLQQTMSDRIQRLNGSIIPETLAQRAEIELLSNLLSLSSESGNRYPEYASPDKINQRLNRLLSVLSALEQASNSVHSDTIYPLIVHIRFFVALTARKIVGNTINHLEKNHTLFPAFGKHLQDIDKHLNVIKTDISNISDRDPLLQFDEIILKLHDSEKTINDYKAFYMGCSKLLALSNQSPQTLVPLNDFHTRLNIARLNIFYSIANAAGHDADLLKLYESLNPEKRPDGKTEIDISFDKLSESYGTSTEYLGSEWCDTLLAYYEELKEIHGDNYPWDHNKLNVMMRDRLKQSVDYIKRLSGQGELSPEYLVASINLRVAALHMYRYPQDLLVMTQVLSDGEHELERLISMRDILLTPVRSLPPAFFTEQSLAKEREAFARARVKFKIE